MSKVPMTVRGHELLQEELKKLKSIDRPNVVKAIAEARAHGDLRENAEYHAAKEQQGFIEGRIREIEGKLSHANVIDVSKVDARGRVVFGATVVLLDEDDGSEITFSAAGKSGWSGRCSGVASCWRVSRSASSASICRSRSSSAAGCSSTGCSDATI